MSDMVAVPLLNANRIVVLGLAGLAFLWLMPALAQEAEPKVLPPKGDVVMEPLSMPILRGKKITGYEYASIIMWLNTRDQANLVCVKLYSLTETFLIDLHDHPISERKKKEGYEEVEERLYKIANKVFGPRVIRRLRVEWSRSSMGEKTTIFGSPTDVQCEASE